MTALEQMKLKFYQHLIRDGYSVAAAEVEWRGYTRWLSQQPNEVVDEHIRRFDLKSNDVRKELGGK